MFQKSTISICFFLIVIMFNFVCCLLLDFQQQQKYQSKCEPIIGECYDQPYRFTSKSALNDNSFQTQKAADAKIKSFEKVLACSNYLKLFICGTYKPSCYEEAALIMQPCKSMCEHVFKRCNPLLVKLSISWSEELNCTRYLEDNPQSCMSDDYGYRKDTPMSSKQLAKQTEYLYEKIVNGFDQQLLLSSASSSLSLSGAVEAAGSFDNHRHHHRISLLKKTNEKEMNQEMLNNNDDDENDNDYDKNNPQPIFESTTKLSITANATASASLVTKVTEEKQSMLDSSKQQDNYLNDYNDELNKYICYNQQLQDSLESIARNLSRFLSASAAAASFNYDTDNSNYKSNKPMDLEIVNDKCVLKCDTDIWFKANEKNLATIWLFVCSLLCLVTSLFTLLNYVTEPEQYYYPKFAFILQSFCLIFYSLIHLVSIYMGKQSIVCNQMDINQIQSFHNINGITHPILISKSYYTTLDDAFDNRNCLVIFSFIYYFRMASLSWWFVFVLSWFLIIKFDINMEKLHKKASKYFHLMAWLLPAFKLLVIFLTRDVDSAELTGLCSVGNSDPEALLKFYIIPTCSYLFIGFILILIGFNKLAFQIKKNLNKQTTLAKTTTTATSTNRNAFKSTISYLNGSSRQQVSIKGDDLSDLRIKIRKHFYCQFFQMGIISFICLLTAAIVLGCEFYEYFYMKNWIKLPKYFDLKSLSSSSSTSIFTSNISKKYNSTADYKRHARSLNQQQSNFHRFQKHESTSLNNLNEKSSEETSLPLLWIFLLKYSMTFVNGLIIAIWSLAYKFFSKANTNNNSILAVKYTNTNKNPTYQQLKSQQRLLNPTKNKESNEIRLNTKGNLIILNSSSSRNNLIGNGNEEYDLKFHKNFKILKMLNNKTTDDSQCSSSLLSGDTELLNKDLENNSNNNNNNHRKSYCLIQPQLQQQQQQRLMAITMANMYSNPKCCCSTSNELNSNKQLSTTTTTGNSSSFSSTNLSNKHNTSNAACCHHLNNHQQQQQLQRYRLSSNRLKSVSSNSINILKQSSEDDERSLIVQEQQYANCDTLLREKSHPIACSSTSINNQHHYCTPNVTLNSNLPICCASQIEEKKKQANKRASSSSVAVQQQQQHHHHHNYHNHHQSMNHYFDMQPLDNHEDNEEEETARPSSTSLRKAPRFKSTPLQV